MGKKQIVHVSLHQTAKVYAVLNFFIVLIFGLLAGIWFLFKGDPLTLTNVIGYIGGVFLAAFFYMILGYLIMILANALYNLVAGSFGGIEFVLKDIDNKDTPKFE